MSVPMTIFIVSAAVFGLASFLYGIFRKFTQMSWMAYQVLIVWLLVILVKTLPAGMGKDMRFYLGLAIVVGSSVLVMGGGAALRFCMHKKKKPAPAFFRFVDRVLGGFTAFFDYAAIVLVAGTAALSVIYYTVDPKLVSFITETAVWKNFFAKYAFDLIPVAILMFALRGGWRVGLGRVILIFLMMALSLGALGLAVFLTVGIPSSRSLIASVAARMSVGTTAGMLIAGGALFALVFLVLFILVGVAGYFLTKLVRHIRFTHFWGFLDGTLGAFLNLVLWLAVILGVYFLIAWVGLGGMGQIAGKLPDAEQLQGVVKAITDVLGYIEKYTQGLVAMLRSSPLSQIFYLGNPFAAKLPLV